MRLTGLVVSDLHLFSARSEYARYEERFLDLCKGKDLLVLNGDIVDFKWSQLGSFEATADATILTS